jgi:hypothetical protein
MKNIPLRCDRQCVHIAANDRSLARLERHRYGQRQQRIVQESFVENGPLTEIDEGAPTSACSGRLCSTDLGWRSRRARNQNDGASDRKRPSSAERSRKTTRQGRQRSARHMRANSVRVQAHGARVTCDQRRVASCQGEVYQLPATGMPVFLNGYASDRRRGCTSPARRCKPPARGCKSSEMRVRGHLERSARSQRRVASVQRKVVR